MDKMFYNMKELAEILPIGTTNLYSLVNTPGFPAIRVNRRIIVPADALKEWIKSSAGKKIRV